MIGCTRSLEELTYVELGYWERPIIIYNTYTNANVRIQSAGKREE